MNVETELRETFRELAEDYLKRLYETQCEGDDQKMAATTIREYIRMLEQRK